MFNSLFFSSSKDRSAEPNFKILKEQLAYAEEILSSLSKLKSYNEYLLNLAPSVEAKEDFLFILDSNIKHMKYLKEIYSFYTGMPLTSKPFIAGSPKSYYDELKKAFRETSKAASYFSSLSISIDNSYYKGMALEILNDILINLNSYSFLAACQ